MCLAKKGHGMLKCIPLRMHGLVQNEKGMTGTELGRLRCVKEGKENYTTKEKNLLKIGS